MSRQQNPPTSGTTSGSANLSRADTLITKIQRWPSSLLAIALAFALLASSYPELFQQTLTLWWSDDGQSQNLLIVPIVLFLLYRQRGELSRLPPRASWPWLLLVLPAVLLLQLAQMIYLQSIAITALLLLPPLIAGAVLGSDVARKAWFPLCYLLLASPLWDYLTPLLQWLAIKASVPLLQLTGLPVFPDGRFIDIPAGQFEIEDGCSGMRYLKAALAISLLYAHLFAEKPRQKVIAVALLVGFSILGNWARIVSVILIGQYTDMQHPLIHDHATFGWWLFFGLLVIWLWLCNRLIQADPPRNPVSGPLFSFARAPSSQLRLLLITPPLLLVLSAPAILHSTYLASPGRWSPIAFPAPAAGPGWTGPEPVTPQQWQTGYPGAAWETKALYRKDQHHVLFYLGIYQQQSQGQELVNDTNTLFNPTEWKLIETRPIPTPESWQPTATINQSLLGQKRRMLVWHWYEIGGRVISNPAQAKLLDTLATLRGANGTAVVAVATEITGSRAEAAAILTDFLNAQPDLRGSLSRVLNP